MIGLMIAPLLVGSTLNRVARRQIVISTLSGPAGITLVFCFTGVGHFIKTAPMAVMLPPWVLCATCWSTSVYITSGVEVAAALANGVLSIGVCLLRISVS